MMLISCEKENDRVEEVRFLRRLEKARFLLNFAIKVLIHDLNNYLSKQNVTSEKHKVWILCTIKNVTPFYY